MLAPKDLLDALSGHASRLLSGETPLPRNEIESQFKALLQSGFSKLDLVSREEFDSQMVVLARTRARLEALEAKVAEMEARSHGDARVKAVLGPTNTGKTHLAIAIALQARDLPRADAAAQAAGAAFRGTISWNTSLGKSIKSLKL